MRFSCIRTSVGICCILYALLIQAQQTQPAAPSNVEVTPGDRQITVTWQSPAEGTGGPVADYRIGWTPPDGIGSATVAADVSEYTIEGLTNDTEYTIEVAAVNASGATSAVAVIETPIAPLPLLPGAPTTLTATPGNGQVELEWAPPEDIGGSAITRYEYRQRAADGDFGSWKIIPDGDDADSDAGNETRSTVTSLTNGIAYTFQVRVANAAGPGEATDEVTTIAGAGLGICDRTPQVRKAILNRLSGISDCAAVTDADLNSLAGELSLSEREIASLRVGDFEGLVTLTTLNLSYNSLSSLSAGIFDGLGSLIGLNLGNNQLSSLPAGVFDNLDSLTWLNLSFNSLSSLSAGVFDGLGSLIWLSLLINQLSSLPAGVFDDLGSLIRLNLGNSQLSSLPADVFDNLDSLTWLNLSVNRLSSLPDGIFERLTSLEIIFLMYNPGSDSFIPSANAGSDRFAVASEVVMLDATATDGGPFGDNVSFAWSQDGSDSTTVTLTGAATATPRFTVPADAPDGTVFRFDLTVIGGNKFGTDKLGILEDDFSRQRLTDSSSVRVTVATPPDAPTALTATTHNSSVDLSWNAPADPGIAPISHYEYRASSDAGTVWDPNWTIAGDATSEVRTQIVSGLTNGTEYTFEVRVVSAVGAGAAARVTATPNVAIFTVSFDPIDYPTNESEGSVILMLRLIGERPLRGDVTANVSTSEGSAFAPHDYVERSSVSVSFTLASPVPQPVTISIVDDDVFEPDDEIFSVIITDVSAAHRDDEAVIDQSEATITIIDNDDAPVLSLSVGATEINEGTSTDVVVEITNESVYAEDQTISLEFTGDAMPEVDYMVMVGDSPLSSPYELTLPAGLSSVSATIIATDDPADETDEMIEITARHDGDIIGEETITIIDNDDVPVLSLSVGATEINEGTSTDVVVEITNESVYAEDQTISLEFTGDAMPEVDYMVMVGDSPLSSPYELTLSAGASTATATIIATDDRADETDEMIEITARHDGDIIGEETITIIDNDDVPVLSLSVGATEINEGTSTDVVVEITNESVYAEDQTISLEFTGDAMPEVDYMVMVGDSPLSSPYELTLSAGASTATATIIATDDRADETDEMIEITARHDGDIIGEETITIIDNDDAPVLSLSVGATEINEGASTDIEVGITNESVYAEDQTITLEFAGDAMLEDDYTVMVGDSPLSSPYELTLLAGLSSVSATIIATDDRADETDEMIEITARHDGDIIGEETITIIDNDDAPVLSLSVGATEINEGASTDIEVGITNESVYAEDQTITLEFAGDAMLEDDYTVMVGDSPLSSPYELTLLAGLSSVSATIIATDDPADETDEMIEITARHDGDIIGEETITIIDNDDAPVLSLSVGATEINEGASTDIEVGITNESVYAEDQTITLEFAGDAMLEDDYTVMVGDSPLSSPYELTLPAGLSSVSATIMTTDDPADETDEMIEITARHDGDIIGEETITIIDNDDAPVLSLSVGATEINEGASTDIEVGITNESVYAEDQTITLEFAGDAMLEDDYTVMVGDSPLSSPYELTLLAGLSSVSATIIATDDPADETDEMIEITARHDGDIIGEETITIIDNDDAPVLSLSVGATEINEGASTDIEVGITNESVYAEDQTITLEFAGDAMLEDDYTVMVGDSPLSSPYELTLLAGLSSVSATIIATDDPADETDEMIEITARHDGDIIGEETITIIDNDDAPVLSLSVGATEINEGASTDIEVGITNESVYAEDQTITLEFAGDAMLEDDYTVMVGDSPLSSPYELTLPAGLSSVSATIIATDDPADETDEMIEITARHDGDIIGEETITIIDNDDAPVLSLSVGATEINEGASTDIEVGITNESVYAEDQTITLEFAGDAMLEDDYTVMVGDSPLSSPYELTLLAGLSSVSATIIATDDPADETDEMIEITARHDGDIIGEETITIIDNDDAPVLSLSVGATEINEGASTDIEVGITNESVYAEDQTITLEFAGDAMLEDDYTVMVGDSPLSSPYELTLLAGLSSVSATIIATDDPADETDEMIEITARHDGDIIGEETITIIDNDDAPVLSLSVGATEINEGASTDIEVGITNESVYAEDQTITLEFAGDAMLEDDYTVMVGDSPLSSPYELTLPAGLSSVSATIIATDDPADETDEMIEITARHDGDIIGEETITIIDNDDAPVLSLSVGATEINEGASTDIEVGITNESVYAEDQTITLEFAGDAMLEDDYTVMVGDSPLSSPYELTLPAGLSSVSATIIATDDPADETDEMIEITARHDGDIIGEETITIIDNDDAPVLSLSVGATEINEGASTDIEVGITNESVYAEDQTITLEFAGDAMLEDDYTVMVGDSPLSSPYELTLLAGLSSVSATIIATDDPADETDEMIEITARHDGDIIGEETITIIDNDDAPVLSLSVGATEINEGASTDIEVGITNESVYAEDQTITLEFAGDAMLEDDYTVMVGDSPLSSPYELTLPAGLSSVSATIIATDDPADETDEMIEITARHDGDIIGEETITIIDNDDAPVLSLSVGATEINEGASTDIEVGITNESVYAEDQTITLEFVGDAMLEDDYTVMVGDSPLSSPYELTLPAGLSSVSATIIATDDPADETDEMIEITARHDGDIIGEETITIIDNDDAPVLSLSVGATEINEGASTDIEVGITNESVYAEDQTITLEFAGDAMLEDDYTVMVGDSPLSSPYELTLLAGLSSVSATIIATDDPADETDEMIEITARHDGDIIGEETITIIDNDDAPVLSLSVGATEINEGASTDIEVGITNESVYAEDQTITLEFAGDAMLEDDYTVMVGDSPLSSPYELTLLAGLSSVSATIIATDDPADETDEMIEITARHDGDIIGEETITIIDNDDAPVLSLSVGATEINEGASTDIEVGITNESVYAEDQTITLEFAGDAMLEDDYTVMVGDSPLSSPYELTLPAGLSSVSATIIATDDPADETDEMIEITARHDGDIIGEETITIIDNDDAPVLSLSVGATEINEGASTDIEVGITNESVYAEDQTITLEFVGDAMLEDDYTVMVGDSPLSSPYELTLPAGLSSVSATIIATDDPADETDEMIEITARHDGDIIGEETITIIDNDDAPVLSLSVGATEINEGASTDIEVGITNESVYAEDQTITLEFAGDAMLEDDYTVMVGDSPLSSPYELTLLAGLSSVSATIIATDDPADETDEMIEITARHDGDIIGEETITIIDNDDAPVLSLSVGATEINEGASTDIEVGITNESVYAEDQTITLEFAGDAMLEDDYTVMVGDSPLSSPYELTLLAGLSSVSATIIATDDPADETDEMIEITARHDGDIIGEETITIIDNDDAPVLSLSVGATEINEGASTDIEVGITNESVYAEDQTITLEFAGDAMLEDDYTVMVGDSPLSSPYELTLLAGLSSVSATIIATDDPADETDEMIEITARHDGDIIGEETITIIDNDDAPVLSLSVGATEINEGASTDIEVGITNESVYAEDQTITLEFAGDAMLEDDYTVMVGDSPLSSPYELTLLAGLSSVSATIIATDDPADETDEMIEITARHDGDIIGEETITIIDNDDAPVLSLSVGATEINEGASTDIEVGITNESVYAEDQTITLEFAGDAMLEDDYTVMVGDSPLSSPYELTLLAGLSSVSATIIATDDPADETDEMIEITARHDGDIIGEETITIIDNDDAPVLSLSVGATEINEGASTDIEVGITNESVYAEDQTITLEFAGDAMLEDDYTVMVGDSPLSSPYELTLPAGLSSVSATIIATDDPADETDEMIEITARHDGDIIGEETITIIDNDDAPVLSLSVGATEINEGASTDIEVGITNESVYAEDQTITLEFAGDAMLEDDYTVMVGDSPLSSPYELTLLAGLSSVSATIIATDDPADETDEMIEITARHDGDIIGEETITIIDNDDAPVLSLSVGATEINEGASTDIEVGITNESVYAEDQTITLEFAGDAMLEDDYTVMVGDSPLSSPYELTLPAGLSSVSATIIATDDPADETDEMIEITARHDGDIIGEETITIIDNDDAPVLSLSVGATEINEGASTDIEVGITNESVYAEDQTITLEFAGDAMLEDDYTVMVGDSPLSSPYELTLPAGLSSVSATIIATDDPADETDEMIEITARHDGDIIGEETITIIDNDDAPVLSLSVGATEINEGASTDIEVGITNESVYAEDQTITLEFAGDAMLEDDYTVMVGDSPLSSPYELTLLAGLSSVSATIIATDDPADETDEMIEITARHDGDIIGEETITIIDNDDAPVLSLSVGATEINEGASTDIEVGITNESVYAEDQTITLEFAGDAMLEDDYTVMVGDSPLSSPYELTLPAGLSSVSATIIATDDPADETDEMIEITARHDGDIIGEETITIIDNDDAPVLSLSVGTTEINEGASTDIEVGITNESVYAEDQTITLEFAGDAMLEDDYTVMVGDSPLSSPYELTLLAGLSSVSATIIATDDPADETDEMIEITARHDGDIIGEETITIIDNDDAPVLSLSVGATEINEGASTDIEVGITNESVYAEDQTITLEFAGDAMLEDDYTVMVGDSPLSSPYELTLLAGLSSVSATIIATDDPADETDEMIEITARHDGDIIGEETITIIDNDDAPVLSLSVGATEINEGASTDIEVGITNESVYAEDQTITLEFAGDAMLEDDYTVMVGDSPLSSPYELTLLAGLSSVSATIIATDDPADETDEMIEITARHDGDIIGEETITIIDNDDAPVLSLSVGATEINEGASTDIEVGITNESVYAEDQTITLEFAGDAMLEDDYTVMVGDSPLSSPYELTLLAGLSSVSATIIATDDPADETDEMIEITARHDGDIIGEETITIIDNDDVPGAPTELVAAAGDTHAVLSWDVPADSGTAPINRYEYRASSDGGNIWDPNWTIAGDATGEVGTQIVSNLVNDTEYTFEVRAVSAAGDGTAARITATPIVDDTGASLTLRRIGDEDGYDLIADVLANAEVSADGSFEVAVGSDIVSCTGCDSLEAFTACEDTRQLCPLNFDDENRRLFLQQLGFTAVIWRAKDANGNIFTGDAEITDYDIDGSLEGVAFAQLFYVAPIVGLANRSKYIPQGSSSTITIEIDVRPAELELGLKAEDFSVEGTLPTWTFTSMPLAVIADGAALEDGNSATIRLLENDLSTDSEMPGLPTLSNPGSETDIMVAYNDPSTWFYTVTRSSFIVRELDVPASFGFRVPFRVLALVDNEERRYVRVSELTDQGLTFKSTPAETGVLIRGEWTVNIIDDLTNPESEAFEIPACPVGTIKCSVMGNFAPTEETPLVIRGVFAGAGFDANSSERLTTTITQTIYVNIVDDQLLPDRIDDLDVDGVRDDYADGDDSAIRNVKFYRDNREFLYAGDETRNDRRSTLIITTGDGKDGEEDGQAIQKPAVGLFSVVVRSVTENAIPHWSALIAESEEDAEIIGIGTPPAYAGSGVYDFEVIFDVDNFDLQARVVIPQREPIAEGSVYYKYINGDRLEIDSDWLEIDSDWVEIDGDWLEIDSDWVEIDVSEVDRTYSAPRTSDNACPSPDAIAYWTPGLNAGHRCVLLEIADGGPNDADSEANGIVANTGAIGGSSVGVDRRRRRGGGGAVGLWWLLLFSGIVSAAMCLKRRNARLTRRIPLQSLR